MKQLTLEYRKGQLAKCLNSGLSDDISKVRSIIGIPLDGFNEEKSAYAWENNLHLPLPNIVKEERGLGSVDEEKEYYEWFEKSFKTQNQLNKILLTEVAKSLCKKYQKFHLDDSWIPTIESLIVYPEDSPKIPLPDSYSFIKIYDEVTETYKAAPVPAIDATPADFKGDFSEDLRSISKTLKIESTLSKNKVYQTLLQYAGRKRKTIPVADLSPHQEVWPWMKTLHEVTGLIEYLSALDDPSNSKIIEQLDRAFWKLKDLVEAREKQMQRLMDNYDKKVNSGECNIEEAEKFYQDNIKALSEVDWAEQDQEVAGKALVNAQKIMDKQEKSIKKTIYKAVKDMPKRKRLKFA